jgi:hypothetical protein
MHVEILREKFMDSLIKKLALAVFVGSAILALAYFVADPKERNVLPSEAISGLGMIIIGIAAVEVVWAWAGGSPIELNVTKLLSLNESLSNTLKQDLDSLRTISDGINSTAVQTKSLVQHTTTIANSAIKVSLTNVGAKQDELGYKPGKLANMIANAKIRIDLGGATLHVVFSNDELYSSLISTKIPVRILLPDPRGVYCTALFKDEFDQSARQFAQALIKRIIQSGTSIQLKLLSKKALTICLLRVDDTMLVVPYMYSSQTQNSPRFEIRGGNSPLFRAYHDEFEALFDIAEPADPQMLIENTL